MLPAGARGQCPVLRPCVRAQGWSQAHVLTLWLAPDDAGHTPALLALFTGEMKLLQPVKSNSFRMSPGCGFPEQPEKEQGAPRELGQGPQVGPALSRALYNQVSRSTSVLPGQTEAPRGPLMQKRKLEVREVRTALGPQHEEK